MNRCRTTNSERKSSGSFQGSTEAGNSTRAEIRPTEVELLENLGELLVEHLADLILAAFKTLFKRPSMLPVKRPARSGIKRDKSNDWSSCGEMQLFAPLKKSEGLTLEASIFEACAARQHRLPASQGTRWRPRWTNWFRLRRLPMTL